MRSLLAILMIAMFFIPALAIDEKNLGSNHPNVALRLNNLARLLQDSNRIGEAEPLMRRAILLIMAKKL